MGAIPDHLRDAHGFRHWDEELYREQYGDLPYDDLHTRDHTDDAPPDHGHILAEGS